MDPPEIFYLHRKPISPEVKAEIDAQFLKRLNDFLQSRPQYFPVQEWHGCSVEHIVQENNQTNHLEFQVETSLTKKTGNL